MLGGASSCSGCRGDAGGAGRAPRRELWARLVLFSQPIKDVVNITLRDISCQAEKNATHFMLRTPLSHCGTSLESQGNAKNEVRGYGGAGGVPIPPGTRDPVGGMPTATAQGLG